MSRTSQIPFQLFPRLLIASLVLLFFTPSAIAQWSIELWSDRMDCGSPRQIAADVTRNGSAHESDNCMTIADGMDKPYAAMRVTNWTDDCVIAVWSDPRKLPCSRDLPYSFQYHAPDIVLKSHSAEVKTDKDSEYACISDISAEVDGEIGYMAYSCGNNATLLRAEGNGDSQAQISSILQSITKYPAPSTTSLIATSSTLSLGSGGDGGGGGGDDDDDDDDDGEEATRGVLETTASLVHDLTSMTKTTSWLPSTLKTSFTAPETLISLSSTLSSATSSPATTSSTAHETASSTPSTFSTTPSSIPTSSPNLIPQGQKQCYTGTTFDRNIVHDKIADFCKTRFDKAIDGKLSASLNGVPTYLGGKATMGWDVVVEISPFELACPAGQSLQSQKASPTSDVCRDTLMTVIDDCPPFKDSTIFKAGGMIFSSCFIWRVYAISH